VRQVPTARFSRKIMRLSGDLPAFPTHTEAGQSVPAEARPGRKSSYIALKKHSGGRTWFSSQTRKTLGNIYD
jgi:hypothetical protein